MGGGARRQSGSERLFCFFFQAEDGIRDLVRSRGLGDVYKRQFWFFALYVIGVGAVYETYDQQFAIYYSHFFESKARGAEVFGYLTTGQIFLDAIVMFLSLIHI